MNSCSSSLGPSHWPAVLIFHLLPLSSQTAALPYRTLDLANAWWYQIHAPPPLPFPTESNISDVPWWIFFLDPKKSQEWLKKIPNFEPLRFRQSSYYVWRILVKLGVVAVFTVSCITLKGWTFDSDRWWTCAFDSYSGYKPYIVTGFHLWIMLTFCLLFNEPTLNIFFKFCLPLFRIKILI